MKRVAFLLYLVTSLAVPHGLAAQTPTDSYIAQLQALGYSNISIGRTFLGRHRILADRDGVTRELIVARNGQLLFDYMDNSQKQPSFEITAPADDDDDAPTAVTRSVDQTDDVDSSDDADANAEIVKDVETETDQTDDASDPDQQDDGNKGDEDDRDDGKDDDDKGDEDGDDKDEDEDRKPVTQPVSENAQ